MKKAYLFLIMIPMMLAVSSCSQTGSALLNSLAKTSDYSKATNIDYGPHSKNKLDIYRPLKSSSSNKNAVLVFFYGGCWGECNEAFDKSDYLFVAQSFASRGYVTVIADFRQYPQVRFPGLMQDASLVVRWVSRNIGSYGGDPNRLILSGHSSGAHIASMLALNTGYLAQENRKNIRGFIGLAGPYDFLPFDEAYQRELFAPLQSEASSQPINFVSSQSPPLLILHGKKDTTVGVHNAQNLAKKAQGLGVRHKLILYPEHDHVGILTAVSRPFQGRSTVLRDMLNFIQQLFVAPE